VACEQTLKPRQSIQERAKEVREAVIRLAQGLKDKRIRLVIDPVTGAPAFAGWDATSKDGVSDACALRILKNTGSPMFAALLAQAQALAGRGVDTRTAVHSHDGGKTWHGGH